MSSTMRNRDKRSSAPISLDLSSVDTEAVETETDSPTSTKFLAWIKTHWVMAGIIGLCAFGVFGSALNYLDDDAKRQTLLKATDRSALSSINPFLAAPLPVATPQLSKEYIYAGSRLLAVEDANANAAPTPTPTGIEGDIIGPNGEPVGGGGVNAGDVSKIRALVLGLVPFDTTTNQYQRADSAPRATFGDGCPVNAGDVTQTRRYILGLDPATPAGGPTVGAPCTPEIPSGASAGRILRAVNGTLAGQQITVAFELDSQGDESSTSFTVNFNPALLSNPSAALGTGVPSGSVLGTNTTEIANGRIGILIDSTNTYAAGTRQILTITFDVAKNTSIDPTVTFGSTPATQSVSNANGSLLPTTYQGFGP